MYLTQKIRIYPTEAQNSVLWDLSEKCRLLYNFALAERRERVEYNSTLPKDKRIYITYEDQSAALPALKKRFPEYIWIYSKVLQQTLKKLNSSYKSFFALYARGDDTARPPRFRGKHYFFTLCYLQSGFKVSAGSVSFSHKHPLKTPLDFQLKYSYHGSNDIKQVELTYDQKKDKWYVVITYKLDPPVYHDNGLYYAIDLGISNIVSGVNVHLKTIQIKNRRADLYWKNKIAEIQSKRDHCKGVTPGHKKSRQWYRYNTKLRKMQQKRAHQLRDFQHFMSKRIVNTTRANTIIIGKLPVKKMAKKKKGTGNAKKTKANKTLNHSLQNTGTLGRFTQFLTYKAEKVGKRVIEIDESYTSQTCCVCGKREKRALYERTINCECGNSTDRDLNSAFNIMERFIKNKDTYRKNYPFLSQQPSTNEESFLHRLDLLRKTAPLISTADS
jgi:putative transposase